MGSSNCTRFLACASPHARRASFSQTSWAAAMSSTAMPRDLNTLVRPAGRRRLDARRKVRRLRRRSTPLRRMTSPYSLRAASRESTIEHGRSHEVVVELPPVRPSRPNRIDMRAGLDPFPSQDRLLSVRRRDNDIRVLDRRANVFRCDRAALGREKTGALGRSAPNSGLLEVAHAASARRGGAPA